MGMPPLIKILSSEEACVNMLQKVRWSQGMHCPYCRSRQVIKWVKYRKVYQRYRCKVCFCTFNDKTGTFFAYRHLSLQGLYWLIVLSLYGHFSWRRIGKILGVSEMTVFGYGKAMMERVKRWQEKRKGKLEGIVELDEAYVKAGLKGRNNQEKIKALGRKARKRGLKRRGNYAKDCPPIIALCERKGEKIVKMLSDLKGERLGERIG